MRDPEMTFRVDREKGTMEPLTFRQDGSIQIYQEVYPEPGKWIPKLHRDLNTFCNQIFNRVPVSRRKAECNFAALMVKLRGTDFIGLHEPCQKRRFFRSYRGLIVALGNGSFPALFAAVLNRLFLPGEQGAGPTLPGLRQVGDFFEMFGEDAKTAAALLDLSLTTRPIAGVGRVEMCGIPAHAVEQYVEKLREFHSVTLAPVEAQTGERRPSTLLSRQEQAIQVTKLR